MIGPFLDVEVLGAAYQGCLRSVTSKSGDSRIWTIALDRRNTGYGFLDSRPNDFKCSSESKHHTLFVSVGSLSSAVGCGLVLPNSRFVLEVVLIVETFFNSTDRASGYIISISSYDGILKIARVSATTIYSKHDRSKLWYIYGNRN